MAMPPSFVDCNVTRCSAAEREPWNGCPRLQPIFEALPLAHHGDIEDRDQVTRRTARSFVRVICVHETTVRTSLGVCTLHA